MSNPPFQVMYRCQKGVSSAQNINFVLISFLVIFIKTESLIWYPTFLLLVVLFSLGCDWAIANKLCSMGPLICIFL